MKKILPLAAGLALSTTALAHNETDATWMDLDADIANLSTTVAKPDGATVNGFLRAYFDSDSDNDIQGWSFEHVRIEANGKVEGFQYKLSTELKSGDGKLADAWVQWKLADGVMARVGRFKQPFLYSFGFLRGSKRLLPDICAGANVGKREPGAMLFGKFDEGTVQWWVAMMNGTDGTTEEQSFYGRAVYNWAGKTAFSKYEGAVDAPADELIGSVALAFNDDQEDTTGGQRMALEGAVEGKGLYVAFEMVEYDEEYVGTCQVTGDPLMDTTPFAVTGSYMLKEDLEGILRFEDFDDADDTSRTTIGIAWYQVMPQWVKWQASYADVSSDDAAVESQVVTLGVTVEF